MDCRFDLASPRAACYLGTDELEGVLASIGAEIANGAVAQAFLDKRRLYTWTPPDPLRSANLVSRRAVGFGVTNELSTMTLYPTGVGRGVRRCRFLRYLLPHSL
jgi:hypothetical protein